MPPSSLTALCCTVSCGCRFGKRGAHSAAPHRRSGAISRPSSVASSTTDDLSSFFPCLEILFLCDNRLARLEPLQLQRLPQLKQLYLFGNDLSSCEGLHDLRRLHTLALDKNRIKAVEPGTLSSCGLLEHLHLDNNRVRDFSEITRCKQLKSLSARSNLFCEVDALRDLSALAKLRVLDLSDNALARHRHYRALSLQHLPKLDELDGRVYSVDDQASLEDMLADAYREAEELGTLEVQAHAGLQLPAIGRKVRISLCSVLRLALRLRLRGGTRLARLAAAHVYTVPPGSVPFKGAEMQGRVRQNRSLDGCGVGPDQRSSSQLHRLTAQCVSVFSEQAQSQLLSFQPAAKNPNECFAGKRAAGRRDANFHGRCVRSNPARRAPNGDKSLTLSSAARDRGVDQGQQV